MLYSLLGTSAPYMESSRVVFRIRNRRSMIPYMDKTGLIVRDWLVASGLTPAAAARRAGVSASTLHRILNAQVDPSVGTLREIGFACGIQLDLTSRRLSDPLAAAAARAMLEDGYNPPDGREVEAWQHRLLRTAVRDNPVEIVKVAALAASPAERSVAVLLSGEISLARVASAGDASMGHWAVSGAAGLYLPPPSAAAIPLTILWCEDARRVLHLIADTDLQPTDRRQRASLAVIPGEPELFAGSFAQGIVRYAAPIQIILDCISLGGSVADDAISEASSW